MNWKNRWTTIVLMTIPVMMTAQQSRKPVSTQEQITMLETRLKVLEDYKTNIEIASQNKADRIELNVDKKIADKTKELEDKCKLAFWFSIIGIPASIGGIIWLWYSRYKAVKDYFAKNMESVIVANSEHIVRIIESEEYDHKLRQNSKLLVLSPNDEANDKIKELFKKFKFRIVRFEVVSEYRTFPTHDLVIFNNESGLFSQPLIDQFVENEQNEDATFVAYTIQNLNRNMKMNFSNSPFTLYHQILSTLKYSFHIRA